jgi:hypothetical protein
MTSKPASWREVLIISQQLSPIDQLRLITELSLRLRRMMGETEPVDLLTLAGVGQDVWARVDVDSYIDQERDSWQA